MPSVLGHRPLQLTDHDVQRRRRQILIGAALALTALLVLHNPTTGYQTTIVHYEPWPMPSLPGSRPDVYPCDPPTAEDRNTAAAQERLLGQAQGHCRIEALDFLHWRSQGALLTYVETIRRLLAIGGGILFVGLAAAWVIGDPKLRQSPDRR